MCLLSSCTLPYLIRVGGSTRLFLWSNIVLRQNTLGRTDLTKNIGRKCRKKLSCSPQSFEEKVVRTRTQKERKDLSEFVCRKKPQLIKSLERTKKAV